jgi:hypothetical protein
VSARRQKAERRSGIRSAHLGHAGLSKWLTNPDNATLGRDEIAALARVDRGSRVIAQKDESGFGYAPTIGYHD